MYTYCEHLYNIVHSIMFDTEDLSVSIDVKCESNKLTKGFATDLMNSMNCALEKITSSINSMNSNLSRRIGELQVSMDQQIALTARKGDAAHDIALKWTNCATRWLN